MTNARRWAWRIGLLTLVAGGITVIAALQIQFDWDPLRFAHLDHYDGQFAYYIAHDGVENAIPDLDSPSFRLLRIIYPLLARLLSFGHPGLVAWTLIGINLIAYAAGTGLVAYLLVIWQASPWYSLTYMAWIGGLVVIFMDLNELLCMAFALAALAAYLDRRIGLTIALFTLSALTKEIGLVLAAGVALHAALGQGKWGQGIAIGGIPFAVWLGWGTILYFWVGPFPTQSAYLALLPPLVGFVTGVRIMGSLRSAVEPGLWLALPATLFTAAALIRVVKTREITLGTALVLAGAMWVLVMPTATWPHPVAAWRVGIPLIITSLLYLAENHQRLLLYAAAFWAPTVMFLPSIIIQM